MNGQPTPLRYSSHNIRQFNIELSNSLFDCRIFWARVVSSETESLFTQYTKHSFYEIQYALQGRIGMIIGDQTPLSFDESDFVVIPPETYHQIVASDETGARFILAFSWKFKNEALEKALSDRLAEPRPYRESPYMRDLLAVILQKEYRDTPLRKESITALVEAFFLEVIEQVCPSTLSAPTSPEASETERRVLEIEAFLHEFGGIGISVAEVAYRFGISERHVSRLFTTLRGYSLRDAINREKRMHIEDLVLSTDLSLSEISALCGFSDEYAMNKFFRRLCKVNLSEFRRIGKAQSNGERYGTF